MKKLLLPLFVAAVLSSCGEAEKKKEKTTDSSKEEVVVENTKTQSGLSAEEFYDKMYEELDEIQNKQDKLINYDNQDKSTEELIQVADETLSELDAVIANIKSYKTVTGNGEKVEEALLKLVESFKRLTIQYKAMADVFSVPDGEWSDEDEARFDDYDLEYEIKFSDAQYDAEDALEDFADENEM